MKRFGNRCAVVALLVLALFSFTRAEASSTLTNSYTFAPNLEIPDDDLVGVADSQTISSPIATITDIRVSLDISGGYTGDLYAYLTFGSGFTVLLNRPGKTDTDSYGYMDSGFNVVFTTSAVNDIHNYQSISNPGGGILMGEWQPDARAVHPDDVVDTSPRTADLSSFIGLNPTGLWTLYLADGSPVGVSTLNKWTVDIIGVVPEPGTWALLGLGLILARMKWKNGSNPGIHTALKKYLALK